MSFFDENSCFQDRRTFGYWSLCYYLFLSPLITLVCYALYTNKDKIILPIYATIDSELTDDSDSGSGDETTADSEAESEEDFDSETEEQSSDEEFDSEKSDIETDEDTEAGSMKEGGSEDEEKDDLDEKRMGKRKIKGFKKEQDSNVSEEDVYKKRKGKPKIKGTSVKKEENSDVSEGSVDKSRKGKLKVKGVFVKEEGKSDDSEEDEEVVVKKRKGKPKIKGTSVKKEENSDVSESSVGKNRKRKLKVKGVFVKDEEKSDDSEEDEDVVDKTRKGKPKIKGTSVKKEENSDVSEGSVDKKRKGKLKTKDQNAKRTQRRNAVLPDKLALEKARKIKPKLESSTRRPDDRTNNKIQLSAKNVKESLDKGSKRKLNEKELSKLVSMNFASKRDTAKINKMYINDSNLKNLKRDIEMADLPKKLKIMPNERANKKSLIEESTSKELEANKKLKKTAVKVGVRVKKSNVVEGVETTRNNKLKRTDKSDFSEDRPKEKRPKKAKNLEKIYIDDDDYPFIFTKQMIFNDINELRARHQVLPLVQSAACATNAQDWATYLATSRKFTLQNGDFGENIWESKSRSPCVNEPCADWYEEKRWYEYGQEFAGSSANLTQMIWKETKAIGIGVAKENDRFVVVANFLPAGNIIGAFSENVLPPKL